MTNFIGQVALQLKDWGAESMQVYGRGLLHLTVLIETMRREGFELSISPPKVIEKEIDRPRNESIVAAHGAV